MSYMLIGGALSGASTLSRKKQQEEYNAKQTEAINKQAAADQKVINTQSQQMAQQTAQARQQLALGSAKTGASNEAKTAATGGAQGSSVDRTSQMLDATASRMDQQLQNNLADQLFQQEMNKLGVVNQQQSQLNQIPEGPTILDTILSGIDGAMKFYTFDQAWQQGNR
ncbi:hypothetical protein CJP72_21120 [Citrobacter sp. NCU1]|uniref:virion core protein, T7 gp14 family n=1 Tax=Citrobacter sp. NCU1 TaxID=2026683 RepID=UPI001390E113|nr:hypothetical protein [Citrobacter sp. NCU1]NDO83179.1 hypothetical protein [Citrobacter sp. NCU1]